MARTNSTVADQVAADMLGIIDSDEHKEIFGQTVALKKSASAEDENDAKGKPPWLEKDKDEDEKKEDKKEEKEEKEEKKEKGEKEEKEEKGDEDDCIGSRMGRTATLSLAIKGLAKISEALDEVGLEASADATVKALETLVADAALVSEAEALGVEPQNLDSDIVSELIGEKSPKA